MSQKITLTLPDPLLKHLQREQHTFSYFSLQEIIIETLRERFMRTAPQNALGKKRGRPQEFDEMSMLSRKHVFSKKGKDIEL
ncbi:MAG: hypothetical protein AABY00_01605 [Nanoarchaeota archaeon]